MRLCCNEAISETELSMSVTVLYQSLSYSEDSFKGSSVVLPKVVVSQEIGQILS